MQNSFESMQNLIKPNIEKFAKHQKFNLDGGDHWWSSFIIYHIVGHFGWQPLPKILQITTMALRFKIETCNKHQALLSFGQSSNWTCCQPSRQPSCMAAIIPALLDDSLYQKSQKRLQWFHHSRQKLASKSKHH